MLFNQSLQSTGKRGFGNGTHRHTTHGHCDLETESVQWQWANSVKTTEVLQTFGKVLWKQVVKRLYFLSLIDRPINLGEGEHLSVRHLD